MAHSHLDPVKHPAGCACGEEPIWTGTSGLSRQRPTSPPPAAEAAVPGGQALLFTTPTCPNCRLAVTMLDKQNFPYQKLNAEENVELAKQFGVKQAPTLVITTENGFEKYAGAGAIKQYAMAPQRLMTEFSPPRPRGGAGQYRAAA